MLLTEDSVLEASLDLWGSPPWALAGRLLPSVPQGSQPVLDLT